MTCSIASPIGHVMEYDWGTVKHGLAVRRRSSANKRSPNKHSSMRPLLYGSGAGVRG